MATALSSAQVDQLTDSLEAGVSALKDTREEMGKRDKKVNDLLKIQEGLDQTNATQANELKATKEELAKIAEELHTLAEQNTNLVHLTRDQLKRVAQATDESDSAYVVTPSGIPMTESLKGHGCPGVIFKCKRQATELGMYLMATMKKDCDVRLKARDWIKQQGGGMRFLPQMPTSFIQEFGNQWAEQMKKLEKGDIFMQDLAGRQTPGSVLVHPEFSSMLIRNVEEHGTFRQNALIWPMGSDTVRIPRRTGGVAVFWEGEATAGTETDPNFDLLGMTVKKMLMLHQMSSELSMDSAINLAALLVLEFALAIATEEDRIGFNGDGTGGNTPGFAGFTGVLGAAGNATAATADAAGVPILLLGDTGDISTLLVDEDELRAMTGLLHTWSRGNAKWYMHRTVHADFDGIANAAGPVVTYREGRSASIMGFQIVDVEGMPASPSGVGLNVAALGDLRKSWILGDRRSMEIETSEHFAFDTDQLTVRAKQRIGFLMLQGNGMIVLQLAAS